MPSWIGSPSIAHMRSLTNSGNAPERTIGQLDARFVARFVEALMDDGV